MSKPAFEDTLPIEESKPAFEDTLPLDGPSGGVFDNAIAKGAELAFTGGQKLATSPLLPVAGGIAGGIFGGGAGPLSDVGATIGGGVGEASRQLISRGLGYPSPQTSGDAATEIAKQGAFQGAANAAGQYIIGPAASMGLKGARAISGKVLPSVFKGTAGIPEAATQAVLNNPEVLNNPGTMDSVRSAAENVINAFRDTKQRVGESIGKIFKKYTGLDNPIDALIAAPENEAQVGNRSYTGLRSGTEPSQIVNEAGQPFRKPVVSQVGQTTSDIAVNPSVPPSSSFSDLTAKYRDVMSGDAFKIPDGSGAVSELPAKDKLAELTNLKRQIQAETNYNRNPVTGVAIDTVKDAALKKMSAEIDAARSALPNGKKLAIADAAWSEISDIFDTVRRDLTDPAKAQDTLMRMLKGDSTWLTAGRAAAKVDAIRRMEQLSGQKILEPAYNELTSMIFKQWSGKGLVSQFMAPADLGGAATALLLGHPVAAAGMAGGALATSPRVVGMGLRAGLAAGDTAAQSAPVIGQAALGLGLSPKARKRD